MQCVGIYVAFIPNDTFINFLYNFNYGVKVENVTLSVNFC